MSSQAYAKAEIHRVSHHNPCPICEKTDWCGVFSDGSAAICMRIEEGAIKETANGGFVHRLNSEPSQHNRPRYRPKKEATQRADAQNLNRVYQDFHAELRLSDPHRVHLREDRKLSLQEIRTLNYKTIPSGDDRLQLAPIISRLTERYGQKLLSVPGFYLTDKGRIWLWGAGGILIPCKDIDGNIKGYQIRVDDAQNGGKYRWLSATQKQRKRGGVSSGPPKPFPRKAPLADAKPTQTCVHAMCVLVYTHNLRGLHGVAMYR